MAIIDVHLDLDSDITLFTVHGDLLADQVIQVVQTEYAATPTLHIVWDLSDSSLDHMTIDGFRRIAAVAKEVRVPGPHAKTAYVGHEDLGYGLLRMYTALAEAAGVRVQYEVFRTLPEAYAWLDPHRPHPGSAAG